MPDPSPTPDEAAVRARLAEARHTDPVPAHVVARLDAVLGDLTADRRGQPSGAATGEGAGPTTAPTAPVVPLASRRRRRVLSAGLVAAAAVVAFGVALPQVLDGGGGGDDMSASTADSDGSSAEFGAREDSGSGAAAQDRGAEASRPGVVALSSDEPLRPAVRALVRRGPDAAYGPVSACVPDVGPGRRAEATWDGLPAVVVVRPSEAGRQVVDVYVCGADEVVGSTTLRGR